MKRHLFILAAALLLSVTAATCHAQNDADSLERVISSRRSIRRYTGQTVSREVLDRIVQNGLKAPSGMNRQSYELRIVDSPELLEDISRSVNPGSKSIFAGAPVRQMLASEACAPYIEKLAFSRDYSLLIVIAIGYPDESPAARPRKDKMVRYIDR